MRFIPRFFHAFLDYTVGLFLLTLPWTFGLPPGAASQISLFLGLGAIVYSLLTKYEVGVIRILPFRAHLVLDFLSGAFFIAAPRLFHLVTELQGIYQVAGGCAQWTGQHPPGHARSADRSRRAWFLLLC